jgi:hypothetical protein
MSIRIVLYDEDSMTSGRSREESVEQLLRRHERAGAAPADACLDAEVVAAWLSGGLGRAELEAAQDHAARCTRCQEMLAAAARVEPAPARTTPWWSVSRVPWLLPLAAAAAALVMWFYIAPAAPQKLSSTTALRQEPAAPRQTAPAAPPPAAAEKTLRGSEPTAKQIPELKDNATLRERKAETQRSAQLDQLEPAAKAVKSPAESAAAAPAPPPRRENMMAFGGVTVQAETVSPNPASRWRTTRQRMIVERSIDGGRTWVEQALPAAADITTGSSPSPDVCWFGGRGGAVAISVDGRTWVFRPLPERVDVKSIDAKDATTAEAITYSDHRYATSDGGRTWQLLPVQEFPAAPF